MNYVQNYWVLELCPSSGILKNTTFRNLDVFPFSGEGETVCCVSQKEQRLRVALSNESNGIVISLPPHLRTETDPDSETLCFLVFRLPEDGHIPKTQ
jgi:hypothetical protein